LNTVQELAALRECTHVLIKRAMAGVRPLVPANQNDSDEAMNRFLEEGGTNMALVIPGKCFEAGRADIHDRQEELGMDVSNTGFKKETISSLVTAMAKAMGTEALASPPLPLLQLVRELKQEKNVLVDIDVDSSRESFAFRTRFAVSGHVGAGQHQAKMDHHFRSHGRRNVKPEEPVQQTAFRLESKRVLGVS
jgi:hypothetical protein